MGDARHKVVQVRLSQIDSVCRLCGKVRGDVAEREYFTANYSGPCGDSFCYHSCDSSSCFPQRGRVCKPCADSHKRPAVKR